ncbi:hypothetical protein GGI18_006047, partial [Coemansia linderi]
MIGAPTERIWPGFRQLPMAPLLHIAKNKPLNNLKLAVPHVSTNTILLLNALLTYDPKKRLSVHAALDHPYFYEMPTGTDPPSNQVNGMRRRRGQLTRQSVFPSRRNWTLYSSPVMTVHQFNKQTSTPAPSSSYARHYLTKHVQVRHGSQATSNAAMAKQGEATKDITTAQLSSYK